MNVYQSMSACTIYGSATAPVSDDHKRKCNKRKKFVYRSSQLLVYQHSGNVLIKPDAQVASATAHLLIDGADCSNTLQDPVGWHCVGWNVQINMENKVGALSCGAECP